MRNELGLSCSWFIPYRNNLSSLKLSNERTTHLLSLLVVIIFFSFLFLLYHLSMLIGWNISSPSKFLILVAPFDTIFLMIKGSDHLSFIFPLGSKVSTLSTFRTKSPSLRFLGLTFLLNALTILFWYPCAWYCALAPFSSIKANCSYLYFTQSSSKTLVSASTLKDSISTLMGNTTSLL